LLELVHRTVNYTYFASLKPATVAYPGPSPSHTVGYGYTPRGRVYDVADNGVVMRLYGFDHNENLTTFVTGPNAIQGEIGVR